MMGGVITHRCTDDCAPPPRFAALHRDAAAHALRFLRLPASPMAPLEWLAFQLLALGQGGAR